MANYIRIRPSGLRISLAKFHCNRLTSVQDIQDYASLVLGGHNVCLYLVLNIVTNKYISFKFTLAD